jgi:LCP family protein required for cell wall assembly
MSPSKGDDVPQDDWIQQTQMFRRVSEPGATTVLPTEPPPTRRRRRPVRRALVVLGVVLAVLIGYAATLIAVAFAGLERVDAFPDGERPPPAPGRTWLIVGSDSRENLTQEQKDELSTGSSDAKLTDTIMMLTTAPNGVATLISIPRDSLVDIPGNGENKINAAYAFGGPKLLVQTVEQATGVRIEGYVEVGFDGFFSLVEAVDGVEVCLDAPIQDERAGIDLPAGCQTLGGADALGFVRARYSDPNGDFGRVERQRDFIAALAAKATTPQVLLNPLTALPLASAAGDALVIDDEAGPVDLARFGLAGMSATGANGQMLTVPFGGYATTSAGSVVLWDSAEADVLWSAVREGTEIPKRLLT